jgi:hypothetical protein
LSTVFIETVTVFIQSAAVKIEKTMVSRWKQFV